MSLDVSATPAPRSDAPASREPFHEAACADTTTGWARFWARYLNDPRDVVFVTTALGMFALAAPLAALLFWLRDFPPWWGLVYLVPFAYLAPRYTLMLHCVSHRPLFKAQYKSLNHFIPWVLGPFYGHTPYSFFAHHMGMHHKEGNLLGDLSTTMPYQRDRLTHWLHYWGKFMLFGLPALARYHVQKGRTKILRQLLAGEASYWVTTALLAWFVSVEATALVFWTTMVIMRTAMMAGNWGQHAFIAPTAPSDDFRSSITCINTRYNRFCFNDGYHIIHHLKPALHYTEMADEFDKHRELYGQKDAIVFDGYDFFQVWLLLMIGRKDLLAKAFVRLPGAPARTDEEVIALIVERMRPFDRAGQPVGFSAAPAAG